MWRESGGGRERVSMRVEGGKGRGKQECGERVLGESRRKREKESNGV